VADEYCYRTASTRLRGEESEQPQPGRTIDEFRRGRQLAVERGFPEGTEKRALQSLAYDAVRESQRRLPRPGST
jgi:hypothetical protein